MQRIGQLSEFQLHEEVNALGSNAIWAAAQVLPAISAFYKPQTTCCMFQGEQEIGEGDGCDLSGAKTFVVIVEKVNPKCHSETIGWRMNKKKYTKLSLIHRRATTAPENSEMSRKKLTSLLLMHQHVLHRLLSRKLLST